MTPEHLLAQHFDPDAYALALKREGIDAQHPIEHWRQAGYPTSPAWMGHSVRVFQGNSYDYQKTNEINASLRYGPATPSSNRASYLGGTSTGNLYVDAMVAPQSGNRQGYLAYECDGTPILDSLLYPGANWTRGVDVSVVDAKSHGTVEGRYLFCGGLSAQFSHFFLESLCRVAALERQKESIDGCIFVDTQCLTLSQNSFQGQILEIFGFRGEILLVSASTRFRELVVPPPEFGLNELAVGTADFRRLVNSRASKTSGSEFDKIYISRSKLLPKKTPQDRSQNAPAIIDTGAALDEHFIEDRLAAEGYRIIHPQSHRIEDCLEIYAGSNRIIAAEGGAVFPAVFAAQREAKFCVLRRGSLFATSLTFPLLLRGFLGRRGYYYDATKAWFEMGNTKRFSEFRRVFTLTNFEKLSRFLFGNDFIDNPRPWQVPDEETIEALISRTENAYREKLRRDDTLSRQLIDGEVVSTSVEIRVR